MFKSKSTDDVTAPTRRSSNTVLATLVSSTATGERVGASGRTASRFDPNKVRFAILIPVYKHSALIVEAVESALAQMIDGDVCVVIVNDGCPHKETDQMCFAIAQSRANVIYLNKSNGGPSSARNYGIDYIVESFPNLDASFFLDADNRLSVDALATGWKLLQDHPDVGWVYPHITTFEVEWTGDYNIPYSRLLHVVYDNLCDTGCVVRAELLRKLRFNANAQSGFEDWDFWLSGVAAGYRGMCCDLFGFEYRNRAESRFKEVSRDRSAVTNYMKERYKKTFDPRRLVAYEHEDAPRFCLVDTESMGVNFFSDPARSWRQDTLQEFCRNFWAAKLEPDKFLVPDILVWGGEKLVRTLVEAGLAHNVFWLIQRQLKTKHFVALSISLRADEIDVKIREIGEGAPISDRIMLIAGRRDIVENCVGDEDQGWLRSLASPVPGPLVSELHFACPAKVGRFTQLTKSVVNTLVMTVSSLRNSSYRQAIDFRWNWRARMFPALNEYPALLERYLKAETVLPRSIAPARADVGFVVPFGSFGGSEKVGYAAAKELRKCGFSTHLFVIGGKGYKIIPEFADAFDTVNLVGSDVPAIWGGSKQGRGTEFGTADDPGLRVPLLIGLLATMDVVVNCQSAPMNAAIGDLRQLGIMTISYIHLFDRSPQLREVGHPFLGLLFEHAYDLFVLCSHNLRHRLHALGMPKEKMLTVENAPSFAIPAEKLAAIRATRTKPGKTLNVLYIGRMDAQKGLERIVGIVEGCVQAELDVAFRFIGSSLVEDGMPAHTRAALHRASIKFEPPIFASDRLADAFAEADVMILPSRWEGAPLVILEAQQAGCIPVATDVGAVAELIEDWRDGVLVPDTLDPEVVLAFVSALTRLQKDKARRSEIALAAMDRLREVSWEKSFGELVARLEKRFPKK